MRYLLVIDSTGNLVLVDVDNGVRMPIGEPLAASQRSRVSNAVWSQVGQWTAWSVDSDDPSGIHELRIHDEASDEAMVLSESTSAFYLCPSPCGRYLSHLSSGPLGLELGVSDVRSGQTWLIERGQPLFSSWSPEGDQLAVHVEDRVFVANVDGSPAWSVCDQAGRFTTPWWLPGGSVVYGIDDRIESISADGSRHVMVDRGAIGRFCLDPDGRRLAFLAATNDDVELAVKDVLTGSVDLLTTKPTAGFFWSSTGHRLAALVMASDVAVQWLVSDGASVVGLDPFVPSRNWANVVLPFFEQYSQSHNVWSPDGTHLVAPALDDSRWSGALLQHVDATTEARFVADAEFAWWA